MNRFSKNCRRCREEIFILATGTLPEEERSAIESHLAQCADCRKYSKEINTLAAPFAVWKQSLAQIEPTAAARLRWANALRSGSSSAAEPAPSSSSWWAEVIWPARHAWSGIAAVWLLLWALNWERPTVLKAGAATAQPPTPLMLQAMAEQRRLLAELLPPAKTSASESPPPNPQPRSERRSSWANS
jgi:anti-sigma factor RsiW